MLIFILPSANNSQYIVRYVPSWFPLASFKRTALKMRRNYTKLLEEPFRLATAQLVSIS